MQTILIIHPEGSANSNPNLFSIISLLSSAYEIIFVQGINACLDQNLNMKNVRYLYFPVTEFINKESLLRIYAQNLQSQKFALAIGVDLGICLADFVAKKQNIPVGLISYEIYPANEWQDNLKQQEIKACAKISFAVCQDSMRAYLLSKENKISPEKIMNIPNAETYGGPYKRTNYLREKFNIPEDKNIILYTGSVWGVEKDLFDSVKKWPDNYVLVYHPRYGVEYLDEVLLKKINENNKIYLSSVPTRTTMELEQIVCSADIGLLLYDYSSDFCGPKSNILLLGLSSGKFSVYTKYGLPVIINNTTNLADVIHKYELGQVVQNIGQIDFDFWLQNDWHNLSKNSTEFFKKYLDFSLYADSLMTIIDHVIAGKDIYDVIIRTNKNIDISSFSVLRELTMLSKLYRVTQYPDSNQVSIKILIKVFMAKIFKKVFFLRKPRK